MTHGCYAVVHTLPDEPVDFAVGLRQQWVDLKQPETVEEDMLVEDMYRGHLMQKRYHRAMDCALVRQTEMNLHRWGQTRQETVAELKQILVTTPADNIENVLDELRGFGHGVRALIGDFEDLAAGLQGPGFWDIERCRTAVLLLGAQPGPEAVAGREEVYRLVLFNFLAMPERLRPPGEIERMLRPENRPPELRSALPTTLLVPAEEARAALQQWVDESVQELNASLEWVETYVDGPSRAAVTDPAAIVIDPEKLKRFKQIGSEYRALYYRASSALRTLRKEQDEGPGKTPRKAAGPNGSRRSTANERPADRRTAVTAPATPQEMEITRMVGESADGAEKAPSGETEGTIEQRVMDRHPGIEAEFGNEPSPGVVAAADRPRPAGAAGPSGAGAGEPAAPQGAPTPGGATTLTPGAAGPASASNRSAGFPLWDEFLAAAAAMQRPDPGRPPPAAGSGSIG
jgi:hypothetical protein